MNELHLPSLALLAAAWAERGWLALLAFTAAVLFVAALRKPCRRWFGAERAFQLWLLPPLALLASQLPHAAAATAPLPPLVYTIISAAGTTASHADGSSHLDWRAMALLSWLVGLAVVLAAAVVAQRRYRRRLRGAVPLTGALASRPVLRAASRDIGPALVGAWRSRIVLPADFDQRYDATEQALILAHEDAHARRDDGWWCLCAQLLAALFWCHPLAWWALAALRHDQELACDAAVLRGHGAQRRSYANAMLKTQSAAFALPVGCTWSPRHPLTERIAMLKLHQPGKLRRAWGSLVVLGVALAVAGSVYATTQPVSPSVSAKHEATEGRYTLKLVVGIGSEPPRYRGTMCLKPGQFYDLTEGRLGKQPPWHGRFTVVPAEHGQLEVRGTMSGGTLDKEVHPIVRTMPGQQATIQIGRRVDGKPGDAHDAGSETSIKMILTPSIGC